MSLDWMPKDNELKDHSVGGEIVYGEFVAGERAKAAREIVTSTPVDSELLDGAVDKIVWQLANLFPSCLQKSIDGIRAKKKFFWDQTKLAEDPERSAPLAVLAGLLWLGKEANLLRLAIGTALIVAALFIAHSAE